MARKKIVAGNWKMNTAKDLAGSLVKEVLQSRRSEDVLTIFCPPFPFLDDVVKLTEGTGCYVAAQNCHQEEEGAYTGEVSAGMIASLGVEYVILGHSERRQYYNEHDKLIKQKIDIAFKNKLIPIYCCGEELKVRSSNKHVSHVVDQISNSLFHLSSEQIKKVVIAYEPVWAIGTGMTATPQQAQEMHWEIRNLIGSKYGNDVSKEISILYGGSCKPGNAAELFDQKDVDGGLIGGASLNAADFVAIINAFST
jgi:triosephosphate isomerase